MKRFRTLLLGIMLHSAVLAQPNPGWQNVPAEALEQTVERLGSAPTIQASAPPQQSSMIQSSSQPPALQHSGVSGSLSPLNTPTPTPGGNVADEITPEIASLARGLRYNPTQIYAFVRNRIDFVPYYGCKKGAHMTLMEMSGNDMDQSALLVALLRASGYAPTYRSGPVAFFPNQHVLWNGISPNPFPTLTDEQFAAAIGTTPSDPQLDNERIFYGLTTYLATFGYPIVERVDVNGVRAFGIPHVWVEVQVDGTTHQLSPSYKEYDWLSGIDLVAATGFDKSQMLTTADPDTGSGDPEGVNWVSNLDYSAISSQLQSYTGNFLSYIRANHDTMDADRVFPGKHLVEKPILSLADADPLIIYNAPWATSETWNLSAIPASRMSELRITAGSYNPGSGTFGTEIYDEALSMPELRGRRLAMSFDSGAASIRLDDTLVGSSFSPSGSSFDLRLSASHDHYTWAYDSGTGQYYKTDTSRGDQEPVQSYNKDDDYTYAFPYAFDNPAKLVRERQEKLAQYYQDGLTYANDWEVRAETLNIMGLEWYAQTWRMHGLVAGLDGGVSVFAHRFGRVAQEDSYYIDVSCQLASSQHRGLWEAYSKNINRMSALFMSAMEHGVIEQLQGASSGAASTVRVIHEANEGNQRIYRATSSNWSSIASGFSGYEDISGIAGEVGNGATALLPASGDTTVGSWEGEGYALENPSSTRMRISGGLNGGYSVIAGPADTQLLVLWSNSDPAWDVTAGNTLMVPYKPLNTPQLASLDPVDLLSGAYFLDKTDLEVSGEGPLGLEFTRHYNSHLRADDSAGLGRGWTHGNHISLRERSSSRAAMGASSSYQMAPMAVAALAAGGLHFNHSSAHEWSTSAMVVHWLVEQMRYNAIALTIGRQTLEFVRMPDGSYIGPPGMKMDLTKNPDGTWLLTERHEFLMDFDAEGRITSLRNYNGAEKTYSYNGSGRLHTVADEFGRQLTYSWSGGRINSVSDGTGRSVSLGYTNGDLTTVTDPEGKVWTYQYDADHRMTSLKDPDNRLIAENDYDSEGRVIRQRSMGDPNREWVYTWSGYVNTEENPNGGLTSYAYDERGRSIVVTNDLLESSVTAYDGQDRIHLERTPKGEETVFAWNADNNLVSATDPESNTTQFFYDTQLRLQTLRDKRGHDTAYSYTGNHQIETVTDPEGNVTTYTYHANGLPHTVEDGEGRTTTTTYDAWGNVSQITRHDGTSETFTNNARGDVLTSTDAEGRTTTKTWNKRRQLLTTTLPSIPGEPAAVTTRTYDNSGNLASVTDANGNTTTHTWNVLGKKVTTTRPALSAGNNVITNTYDTRDWLMETENSLGHTTTREYDGAHRETDVIDPLNRRTEKTHDANGRLLETEDPLDRVTSSTWTSRGEVDSRTDGEGEDTGYVYDANGNRTELTNRRGKTYTFSYDDADRQTGTTTPTGKTTTKTYFGNDLVESIEEPSGQTTTMAYNGKNLVSSKNDPTGSISYGYDDSGMLETVTEGGDTITRTYDQRGRLETFTTPDGDLLQYEYDPQGNFTRLVYPDGRAVDYTYNERNQLETVTDWDSRTTTYTYDRIGRLTGISRPNGTSCALTYDAAGQLLERRESAGGAMFSYLRFEYDAAGQISSHFRAPLFPSGWDHPDVSAAYDDDNRLATFDGQGVVYDDDGNMSYGPISSDSGGLNLGYNSRNELTSADGISYTYDAEGRRRTITDSAGTTRDVIDPNAEMSRLLVRHHPGGVRTFYVYGLGLLYEIDESGDTLTHHYDQVGSTIARTDDAGEVIGRAAYSAYGLTVRTEGDMDTPFRYNGRWGVTTEKNGLLHMRARYYSPYLMRFLNEDPIGFEGGSNWYAYAGGDPIRFSDQSGLSPQFETAYMEKMFGGIYEFFVGGDVHSGGGYTPPRDRHGRQAAGGALGGVVTGATLGIIPRQSVTDTRIGDYGHYTGAAYGGSMTTFTTLGGGVGSGSARMAGLGISRGYAATQTYVGSQVTASSISQLGAGYVGGTFSAGFFNRTLDINAPIPRENHIFLTPLRAGDAAGRVFDDAVRKEFWRHIK